MLVQNLNFDFINLLQFIKRPFKARFVPSNVWIELDQHKNCVASLSKYLKKFKINLQLEFITVSGEFDGDNQQITIYIYEGFDTFKFDIEIWDEFKFSIIQTIMHELIHWSQYSMRGDELCWAYKCNSSEQEYYSLSDEIQAYSHCIVLEKMFTGILSHSTKSEIFQVVFNNDYSNKALKQYSKWICRWERIYSKV